MLRSTPLVLVVVFGAGCALDAAPGHSTDGAQPARVGQTRAKVVPTHVVPTGAQPTSRSIRAELATDGRVAVRTPGRAAISVSTTAWGREQAAAGVDAEARTQPCPTDADPRCTTTLERYDAGLREWWRPAVGGVELGWDLLVRPTGDGPVHIDVAFAESNGNAVAVETVVGGLNVRSAGAGAFTVHAPRAWDAARRDVPASISASEDGFRIANDDRGATWPITVDPLITVAGWTWHDGIAGWADAAGVNDVNGDGFEDLIVGHYSWPNTSSDGALYLFYGSPSGFASTPDWIYNSPIVGAELGFDVDSAGDVDGDGFADIVAGAAHEGDGTVHVFRGAPSGPGTAPWWSAGGPPGGSLFAVAVAGAGDVNGDGFADVAAGSFAFSNGTTQEGIVSVWHGGASILGPAFTVEGSDVGLTWFGDVITDAGDTNGDGFGELAVGSRQVGGYAGAALVFGGGPSGLGTSPLWSGAGTAASNYGQSVAGQGDVTGDGFADLLVAAPLAGSSDIGDLTLYVGGPSGPSASGAWSTSGTQPGEGFGATLAPAGDLDGDGLADISIGSFAGGAVLFGGPVPLASPLPLNQGSSFAWPRSAVDAHADGHSDLAIVDQNTTFTLPVTPTTNLTEDPLWPWSSGQIGAAGGTALAVLSDADGDGFAELVAGSPGWDIGGTDEGQVVLWSGSTTGPSAAPTTTLDGTQSGAAFGTALDGRGDVNADGYADLLVGAPLHNDGQLQEGAATLRLGGPSGLSSAPAWTATSDQGGARLGSSVRFVGDVNGDGFDDATVGLLQWDGGQSNEGAVWLYYGTSTGLTTTAAWTAESDQSQAMAVGGPAGDIDGDGFADVLWNARGYDDGGTDNGRVAVFFGSAGGPTSTPQWARSGALSGGWFGSAVEPVGDVDGDGFTDLLIGASRWSNGEALEGAAFLYTGGPGGPSLAPAAVAEGAQDGAAFGTALAAIADADLDGLADLAIGAPGWDDGANADAGAVYLFLSSEGGLRDGVVPQWSGATAGEALGTSIAGAWDSNGDGRYELAAGAPGFAGVGAGEGAVRRWVLDGPTSPWPSRFRATRPGTDIPIAPGLRSGADGAFDVRAFAHSPFGRTRASIDLEVVPISAPFTGTPTHPAASFVDTGLGGADVVASVTGLGTGAYRWRVRLRWDPSQRPPTPWGPWVEGGGGRGGAHVVADVFGPSPDDADGDGDNDASDCAPSDPWIGPSATEVAGDGVDSDCDALELCFEDGDQDGFRTGASFTVADWSCPTSLGAAPATAGFDCDDTAPLAYPGAPELNGTGLDEDCDGLEWCWEDVDADGAHGDSPILSDDLDCDDAGEVSDSVPGGDCDDFDAAIGPGAFDLCGDAVDQDCDGADASCGDDDDSATGDDDSSTGDDDSSSGNDDSAPGDDDTSNPGDDDSIPDDDSAVGDDDSGDDDSGDDDSGVVDDDTSDDDSVANDDTADDDTTDDDTVVDDDSAPADDDSGDDDSGDDDSGDDDSGDDDTTADDDATDPDTTTYWEGGPGCVFACEGSGSGAAVLGLLLVTRLRRRARHSRSGDDGRSGREGAATAARASLFFVAFLLLPSRPASAAAADAPAAGRPPTAEPKGKGSPPPDFAELLSYAQELHGRWCTVADGPEPDRAYDAQAEIWPTLEAIHDALSEGAPTYLRYWRALLGACIDRDAQAIADLETFLEVDGNNPSFVSMVKDARARLARMQRAVARNDTGPDFGTLPRFGLRLGGGWARWSLWNYVDLNPSVELRLAGPLHLTVGLRVAIGEPMTPVAGDSASEFLRPVLTSGSVGVNFRIPGPVVPEFGVSAIVAGNPASTIAGHDVADRGTPVIAGPAGSAGLSIPIGPAAIFVTAEGAYLHPHPGVRIVAGLRLSP